MRTIFPYCLQALCVDVILMMNCYLKNYCLSCHLMKRNYLKMSAYHYLMMYWTFLCYFVDCFVCGFLLYL